MNALRVLFLFLATFMLNGAYTQAPPCDATSPLPGKNVCLATPICNFDGYCGRTNKNTGPFGTDQVAAWQLLKDAVYTASQSGGDGITVDNDFYLKFIANSTTISFDVYVYDCTKPITTKAIQLAVFSADDCTGGPVTVYQAYLKLMEQTNAHNIVVNGLTPGNVYYILLDGYSGQNCGFTFVANDGIAMPEVEVALTPSNTVCIGEQVTAIASGGENAYTWSGDNGLSATIGTSVTITPPAAVGTYNYTVDAAGGNAFCPESSSKDFSIIVENCDNCTPPTLTIQPLSTCTETSLDLNTAIDSGSQTATNTFYSTQTNATNATNAINATVTTSGTYYVRAENPTDPTCFQVYPVTVTIGSISYTAVVTNTSCGASDGQIVLTVTGGTNPISYSIDNGTTTQTTNTFANLPAGTYPIFIKDQAGCEATGTETISNANGPNITNVNAQNPSCGDACDGTISLTVENGQTPYTFAWMHDNNAMGIDAPDLTDLCAGGYFVTVTDNSGCTTQTNVTMEHTPRDNGTFSFAGYCEGKQNGPTNIVTTGGTFSFNPAVTDGTTIQPQTGAISNGKGGTTYTVQYITSGICPDTTTQTVTVSPNPTVAFTANPTETEITQPVITFTNNSQNATSYSWNFGDNSAVNHEENPTHDYGMNAGTYTVVLSASNAAGCTAKANQQIVIKNVPVIYQVPNVFTPNGDNSNSYFEFVTVQNIEKVELVILNRWGTKVFESKDVNLKWDGKTAGGNECSDGVYFYQMTLFDSNGHRRQENGFVTLTR